MDCSVLNRMEKRNISGGTPRASGDGRGERGPSKPRSSAGPQGRATRFPGRPHQLPRYLAVYLFLLVLAGCPSNPQPPAQPSAPTGQAPPPPSVALQVVVVNDPPLSEAINRLRGEWAERSGGSLTATSKPLSEVMAAKSLDADLLIFPTRYLGELAMRDFLRPVRANVLEAKSLNVEDFFPLVYRELITWDGQVMALPLGVQLPASVPSSDMDSPAVALLARAAPYAVYHDRAGPLFDPQTMKPRITEKSFERALLELSKQKDTADSATSQSPDVNEIYNASTGQWEKLSGRRQVPLLGVGDRLAAVTASSRNAATAFKLLAWLAEPDSSSQLARAGNGTMPVRKSLASSPSWYDPKLTASERSNLAKALEQSLTSQECLVIPRIPGIEDYLAALDEAAKDTLAGKVDPQASLKQAADQWEKITESRGRDAQRAAYLKHLGITEP